jgi:hypothetical protein
MHILQDKDLQHVDDEVKTSCGAKYSGQNKKQRTCFI